MGEAGKEKRRKRALAFENGHCTDDDEKGGQYGAISKIICNRIELIGSLLVLKLEMSQTLFLHLLFQILYLRMEYKCSQKKNESEL